MKPSSRALLAYAGAPMLLVSDPTNIRYLTGMSVSAGSVLVTPRSFLLFVDPRYGEAAAQTANANVLVRDVSMLEKTMKRVPECAVEEEHVTLAQLRKWKAAFTETKLTRASGTVEWFRRTKDDDELKLLRRAQRITEEMLRRVPAALRKGVTEKALAWKLQTWARELGADGLSFDPIVAFGSNTSRPHHQPTTRALQKGHLVQIDVGARYRGYCADLSQVFFTDEPTAMERKALQAVSDAKDAAIEATEVGATTHDLDRIARAVLHRYGMDKYFTHSLGHGVGLDVHEGPVLSQRRPEEALMKNEVMTVEPGVYFPGKFGMRVEEMIVV